MTDTPTPETDDRDVDQASATDPTTEAGRRTVAPDVKTEPHPMGEPSPLEQAGTRTPAALEELRRIVGEAVGAASACWDNLDGAGTFQSEQALKVADRLLEDVVRVTALGLPSLGLATTEQLLDEICARIVIGGLAPGGQGLGYSTL